MGTAGWIGRRSAPSTRDLRAPFGVTAALVSAIAGLALVIASPAAAAAPGSALVQPAGASFAAAYPGPPGHLTATAAELRRFPGAQAATAFFVSPDPHDVLGTPSSPIPRAPSFAVLQLTFGSYQAAQVYVEGFASAPAMKPVLDGSVAIGYQFIGREAGPLNPTSSVRQPHAFESVRVRAGGDVVYLALAVTKTRGSAVRFTQSVRIGGVAPTPQYPTATGAAQPPFAVQPGAGQLFVTTYQPGRGFAVVLIGLLVLGLIVVGLVAWYWSRDRRPGDWPAAGPPYAGMPAAPLANAQFTWSYQPPSGSGDMSPGPPAGPPPPN